LSGLFKYNFSGFLLLLAGSLLIVSCGRTISPENPLKREKINDGVSRKIIVEDKFEWAQIFTRIEANTPDGEQKFRVQVRSKKDSLLWAAISDDMIGLRVGKAIVIEDSAAFTSTLLGLDWTGSAQDLAGMTGVEVPFQYLNRLLRGQLISAEPAMRYRFDAKRDIWVTKYAISGNRKVEVDLDRDLRVKHMTITDPTEIVDIEYSNTDERTGYPKMLELTLKSRPSYTVKIEVSEIRTEGPYNTPFSF
jgi:hypothetical protein